MTTNTADTHAGPHIVHPKQLSAMINGREYNMTQRVTVGGIAPPGFAQFVVIVRGQIPLLRDGRQCLHPETREPLMVQADKPAPIFADTPEMAFAQVVAIVEKTKHEIEAELKQQMNPIVVAQPAAILNGENRLRLRN